MLAILIPEKWYEHGLTSISDYLTISKSSLKLIYVGIWIAIISLWMKQSFRRSDWPFALLLSLLFLAIIAPEEWYDTALISLYGLWKSSPLTANIIGIALILGLGWTMNKLKKRNQMLYGALEIALSLAGSLWVTNRYLEVRDVNASYEDILGVLAPFITAVYFAQRGFNNYYEGQTNKAN